MAFDVEGARKAGYSDGEIVDHLASERKFDAAGARQSGYSDTELLTHLAEPAKAAEPKRSLGERAARGLGLGVRDVAEGVAALPGLVYDVAALPINAGIAGVNALGGNLPYVNRAGDNVSGALTAAGLPVAETDMERGVSAVSRGAASALPTMGAGLALQAPGAVRAVAPSLQNALLRPLGAGKAGAAHAVAEQVLPNVAGEVAAEGARAGGAGPLGQSAAALLAGGGTGIGYGVASNVAEGVTAPLRVAGREGATAETLLRSSSDPRTLANRLPAGAEPLVPGSLPTTAEAAADPGLATLQRGVQNIDGQAGGAFAQREAERDAARRAAAVAIQPEAGGAPVVAQAVQGVVAREEQRAGQATTRANALLQGRLGQLPEPVTPEAAGAAVRGGVREAEGPARAANSAQYEAIDPDGTSRLPLEPVRTAAAEAEAKYFGDMAGPMPAALRSAIDDISGANTTSPPDVAAWRSMQNLRSRLGAIAGDPNADPRAKAAARQIQQSIDETAERAALPQEMPSRPIGPDDIDQGYAAEGAGQHPDIAERLTLSRDDLGATAGAAPGPEGLSLVQFLRSQGGLQNQSGEIGAMMGGTARTMPGLWNNRGGLTLERAAQRAFEKGYIREQAVDQSTGEGKYSTRELLAAIDAELRGSSKNYAGGDVRGQRGGSRAPTVADDLDQEISARGGSYSPDDPNATLRSLRGAEENPATAGVEMPDRFAPIPNAFTPEQAEAWRGASAGRRDVGDRFDSGANERILRRDMGRDVVPDSAVMREVFKPGGGGPEALRQVRAEISGNAGATAALEGHAATSLRTAAARPDGTIDPARWQAWMGKHADVLREMPELAGRMRSAGEAAATLDRVAFAAQARVKELERGVAKPFLKQDPADAVRTIMASKSADRDMAELLQLVGRDPAAVRAVKRAYLDEWLSRSESTTLDATATNYRLKPSTAINFERDTKGVARQVFTPEEMQRVEAIAADFASGQYANNAARAVGSNTAQNLSTAHFIAKASGGVLDPNGTVMRTVFGRVLFMNFVYGDAERIMRDLLVEATLNPAVARDLLGKLSPEAARRAMGYVDRTLWQRTTDAAGEQAVKQGVRSATGEGMRRENALAGGRPAPGPRNALLPAN